MKTKNNNVLIVVKDVGEVRERRASICDAWSPNDGLNPFQKFLCFAWLKDDPLKPKASSRSVCLSSQAKQSCDHLDYYGYPKRGVMDKMHVIST